MTLPTFSMEPPLEKVLTFSTLRVGATRSVSLLPLSRLNVLGTLSFCRINSQFLQQFTFIHPVIWLYRHGAYRQGCQHIKAMRNVVGTCMYFKFQS